MATAALFFPLYRDMCRLLLGEKWPLEVIPPLLDNQGERLLYRVQEGSLYSSLRGNFPAETVCISGKEEEEETSSCIRKTYPLWVGFKQERGKTV